MKSEYKRQPSHLPSKNHNKTDFSASLVSAFFAVQVLRTTQGFEHTIDEEKVIVISYNVKKIPK